MWQDNIKCSCQLNRVIHKQRNIQDIPLFMYNFKEITF